MASFANINVSQGSEATYVRCSGIFNILKYAFNCKFTKESSSEKICKSVKIWQNYNHESVAPFFGPLCSNDGRFSRKENIWLEATNSLIRFDLVLYN